MFQPSVISRVGFVLFTTVGVAGCAQFGGIISSSSDPVAETRWESVGTISNDNIVASLHDGDRFVVVTVSGDVITSEDAVEWTIRSSVAGTRVTDIAYSNGLYVLTGDRLYTSTNLRRWQENLATITYNLNAVIARGDVFWAVGDKGKILTSSDGHKWASAISTTSENLNAVAGSPGNLTAVGDNGMILMSQGPIWVEAREGKKGQPSLYGVVYQSGKFVAVGAQGATWSSSTGLDGWTSHSSGSDGWLLDVIYLDAVGQFVAVGTNGAAVVSPDGDSWTAQSVTTTADLWSVVSVNGQSIYAFGEAGTVVTRITGQDSGS